MEKTNLNISPYFDDFDESKNFHRVLFRPGYAVQGRELTQLQTILQSQIERFGNHIFKHGSMVVPGNSTSDLKVPYAKLEATSIGASFPDDIFKEGDEIVGVTNGVRAIVKTFANVDGVDPKTVYFTYTSGGTTLGVPNGVNTFVEGEELQLLSNGLITARIKTGGGLGYGSLAYVGDGVFYINGFFVAVKKQVIVIDRYSSTPTCRVGLVITEKIVDSESDSTLLDPAQGSYNYAAPGADRLSIELTLTRFDYDDASTDNYVELIRYDSGNLEEHVRFPKYSELEKSLAKRTYEESGNYRVSGLNVTLNEHKRTFISDGVVPNGGLFADGDPAKFAVTISPGRAYVNGFGIDKPGFTRKIFDKARTGSSTLQKNDISVRPSIGQYLYVSDISGGAIDFATFPSINLFLYGTTTNIGTATVYTIDHIYGASTNRVFALGFYNLSLNSGYTLANVGGFNLVSNAGITGKVCQKYKITKPAIDFPSGSVITYNTSVRLATVEVYDPSTLSLYVYRHSATATPIRGDYIVSGTSNASIAEVSTSISNDNSAAIIQLPYNSIKRVKDINNLSNIKYYIWKHLTIATNGSGNGSVSTSAGEKVLAIEDGTFIALGATGVVANGLFSLNPGQTTLTITGGPVSSNVIVSCVVEKTNIQERTKTLTQTTYSTTINGATPVITLPNKDIYKITSVVLEPAGVAQDITKYCKMDNGQRDFFYDFGKVTYLATLSSVKNVTVTYSYFTHSTGDYFSIDSYITTLGSTVYDDVKQYSSSSNQTFDLKNCLDFRYSGTSSGIPVSNYSATMSMQYFVGYNILVYMDTKDVKFVAGVAGELPQTPKLPDGMLRIGKIIVPPYTSAMSDVKVIEDNNYRYTMADIGKLDTRISTLEYFSTLTMKEKGLVDFEIIDATTGLNRFKSGLIVEEFKEQLVSSDMTNRYNSVSFLGGGITATVTNDQNVVSVLGGGLSTNIKVMDTDKVLMDYDEVEWASNSLSSKSENLNPYLVFSWKGQVKLIPDFDSFVTTVSLAGTNNMNLVNTISVESETNKVILADAPPARTVTVTVPWNGSASTSTVTTPAVTTPTVASSWTTIANSAGGAWTGWAGVQTTPTTNITVINSQGLPVTRTVNMRWVTAANSTGGSWVADI